MASWNNDKETARKDWLLTLPETERSYATVAEWLKSLFPGRGVTTPGGPRSSAKKEFWRRLQSSLADPNLSKRLNSSHRERSKLVLSQLVCAFHAREGSGWPAAHYWDSLQKFLGKYTWKTLPTPPRSATVGIDKASLRE